MMQDTGPPGYDPYRAQEVKRLTWACKNGYHDACRGEVVFYNVHLRCDCNHHKDYLEVLA